MLPKNLDLTPSITFGLDAHIRRGEESLEHSIRPNVSLQISQNIPFQLQCAISPSLKLKNSKPYIGIQFLRSTQPSSISFHKELYASEGSTDYGIPSLNYQISPRINVRSNLKDLIHVNLNTYTVQFKSLKIYEQKTTNKKEYVQSVSKPLESNIDYKIGYGSTPPLYLYLLTYVLLITSLISYLFSLKWFTDHPKNKSDKIINNKKKYLKQVYIRLYEKRLYKT